ncbi:hypothetical protein IAT40_002898 [Kwoniella sp. CBS 6097]
MEARNQRMLEEVLKLPGNDNCADCHAPAPRWASVNLGIFLCVGCASVHRKMGTHKSRVKSVTLDTWSREQITNMKTIGNLSSNATWNPNEALHPPPATFSAEERDSEIERYIRKKYEQGAFRGGAAARLDGRPEPTSLNRARERDGRLPPGAMDGGLARDNARNPELNDIVLPRRKEERDLPPLPPGSGNRSPAPPRARPVRSSSSQNISPWSTAPNGTLPATQPPTHVLTETEANLIDVSGPSASSTLPLQVNMSGSTSASGSSSNGYLSAQPSFSTSPAPLPASGFSSSPNQFGNSTGNGMVNGFSTSPQATMGMGMGLGSGMYGQQLSPQPIYGGQLPNRGQGQQISPQQIYGQQLSPQPTYNQQIQISPQMQAYSAFSNPQSGVTSNATPSPSFMSSGTFGSSPSVQTPQGYASSSHSPSFMPQQLQQQYHVQNQPQFQQQQQQYQSAQQTGMGYGQPYAAPKPPTQLNQVYGGGAGYGYGQEQMGMGMNVNMNKGMGMGR